MRRTAALVPVVPFLLLAACAIPADGSAPANDPIPEGMAQAMAQAAEATVEHVWLRKLVGVWDVVADLSGAEESGAPAMEVRIVEEVEALGDYWIVSQLSADFGGVPFRSRMTVGWDPARGIFVATWVDTLSTYMWVYSGELDAGRNALTFEAEGPSPMDPATTTRFRDVTEFDGPNLRHSSSWILGSDGEWSLMSRSTATRR
jgi:hypothetical protein